MDLFKLDISEIAELATSVAINGAIRVSDGTDELFEYIVGIAVLIYEINPNI